MMKMMSISPFGPRGYGRPLRGQQDLFTSTTLSRHRGFLAFHFVKVKGTDQQYLQVYCLYGYLMMILSPFGQLGLWALSFGFETYSHQSIVRLYDEDGDDDTDPWALLTWALGALFGGAKRTHINQLYNYMMMMMMMMMIISPFGQLGLWVPSSGVRDVYTSIAYVSQNSPVYRLMWI
jgi:hypothetical protein